MQTLKRRLGGVFLSAVLPLAGAVFAAGGDNVHWPSFRGPQASGVSDGAALPVTWNVEKNENIQWKTPIPGLAHSCPVIWGDRVYALTAVGEKEASLKIGLYGDVQSVPEEGVQSWRIYALDKKTGKILWEREVFKGVPKIKRHTKASHANSTPATDGKHIVFFCSSEGLFCYGTDGELLWKKDLGPLDAGWYVDTKAQWGFGSSPIIYEDKVIIQCDVQKDSFLAALSLKDGKELWRTPRDEVPTWSTPTIYKGKGRAQIIVNGYKHIGGYDLATGKELWKLKGGGDIPVPTPIVAHDLIFVTNAHGMLAPLYAIDPGATGEIAPPDDGSSSQYVPWWHPRKGIYMQTPLAYGDYLYCCRDNGVLFCFQSKTGEQVYQKRLGSGRSGFTASGVAGDDKLYFTSEEGEVYVVKAGPQFESLATNSLGEPCMATPAISEGTLFFRTERHLIAIANRGGKGESTGGK